MFRCEVNLLSFFLPHSLRCWEDFLERLGFFALKGFGSSRTWWLVHGMMELLEVRALEMRAPKPFSTQLSRWLLGSYSKIPFAVRFFWETNKAWRLALRTLALLSARFPVAMEHMEEEVVGQRATRDDSTFWHSCILGENKGGFLSACQAR